MLCVEEEKRRAAKVSRGVVGGWRLAAGPGARGLQGSIAAHRSTLVARIAQAGCSVHLNCALFLDATVRDCPCACPCPPWTRPPLTCPTMRTRHHPPSPLNLHTDDGQVRRLPRRCQEPHDPRHPRAAQQAPAPEQPRAVVAARRRGSWAISAKTPTAACPRRQTTTRACRRRTSLVRTR